MAKQSAKSKGYRKTVKKKPFLTKKELIALIVIVAVIALGIVLFNLFYDDGYLRAGDVKPGDVVSYVSREIDSRYVKVATAKELPGFTRSDSDLSVNPRAVYSYTPDEETDHIVSISLSGSYSPASEQMESSKNSLSSFGDSSLVFSEQQSTTVQGHDAYVYSYTYDYYEEPTAEDAEGAEATEGTEAAEGAEADAGAHESNSFNQTLGCYVDVDGYTVCFHIYRSGEDDSFYLPEDQVMDYLLPYTDAFEVYEKEAE